MCAKSADVGKRRGAYIVCHFCGAIRPIIVDLIEVGVDVLNPIQRSCPGLHPLELRKEFGSDLIFMRGLTRRMFRPMAQSIKYEKRQSNCLKE